MGWVRLDRGMLNPNPTPFHVCILILDLDPIQYMIRLGRSMENILDLDGVIYNLDLKYLSPGELWFVSRPTSVY